MSHFTNEQLQFLRSQLMSDKRDIEHRLSENEHYGLGDSLKLQTGELSPIDNHPGDIATEVYEREKDISLLEHDEFQLERIDSALHSIEEGHYGTCAVCQQPIPYERMEAVPSTSQQSTSDNLNSHDKIEELHTLTNRLANELERSRIAQYTELLNSPWNALKPEANRSVFTSKRNSEHVPFN